MLISAAGNKAVRPVHTARRRTAAGFTLLELLLVLAIIAMAVVSVRLSMPDSLQILLERDAQRLATLLDAARSQSRARGVAVRWKTTPHGFRFEGLPADTLPEHWLDASTAAQSEAPLELGPEPIIARQSITLHSTRAPGQTWRVGTDGLRPFTVEPMDSGAAAPSS